VAKKKNTHTYIYINIKQNLSEYKIRKGKKETKCKQTSKNNSSVMWKCERKLYTFSVTNNDTIKVYDLQIARIYYYIYIKLLFW